MRQLDRAFVLLRRRGMARFVLLRQMLSQGRDVLVEAKAQEILLMRLGGLIGHRVRCSCCSGGASLEPVRPGHRRNSTTAFPDLTPPGGLWLRDDFGRAPFS